MSLKQQSLLYRGTHSATVQTIITKILSFLAKLLQVDNLKPLYICATPVQKMSLLVEAFVIPAKLWPEIPDT
jgi:hypothetical protein